MPDINGSEIGCIESQKEVFAEFTVEESAVTLLSDSLLQEKSATVMAAMPVMRSNECLIIFVVFKNVTQCKEVLLV